MARRGRFVDAETALPRQPAWRDSVSGEPLAKSALALRPWLPKSFADRLRYH